MTTGQRGNNVLAAQDSFNPRMLGSLSAWFDALDTRTMLSGDGATITDGGAVALWGDKSGNSGVNCLVLPGAASNKATLPDEAALNISTLDVSLDLAAADWTPSLEVGPIGQWEDAGNQKAWLLQIFTTGVLRLSISVNGSSATGTYDSTVAPTVSDLGRLQIRFTRDSASGEVKFYTRASSSAAWTQLGTTVAGATGALFNSTAKLVIGDYREGAGGRPFAGRIYSATVKDGIDGTTVVSVDFSTAPKKLANGDTFTCATGQTVTLNSSGATGARIAGERDLFQGTLANRPIYLQYAGTKYGYLNAVAGNAFYTPNATGNQIVADITITFGGILPDWTPASEMVLVAKEAGDPLRAFWLELNTNGTLTLNWTTTGSIASLVTATSTEAVGATDGTLQYVQATMDVDDGAGNRVIKFKKSSDGVTWSAIGTTVTAAGTTSIANVATNLSVGARGGSFVTRALNGRVVYADIWDGYDGAGTKKQVFDPSLYTSGTTFTASTGEVWTINGGAHIVTRTGLYFDGSNDYLKTAAFSLSQPESVYIVGSQVSWTSGEVVFDGNSADTMDLIQTTNGGGASPRVRLYAGSYATNVDDWSLQTAAAISAVFNGASSSLRKNRGTASTGNPGAANANGFNIGSGSTPGGYSNVFVDEVSIYAAAHATATQDRMALFASRKWGFSV